MKKLKIILLFSFILSIIVLIFRIKNDLVEAIIILPMNMFYTTNISVTIWVFNKNKKAKTSFSGRELRNREHEVLFMDLRQKGHPYEKKFIEFTQEDRNEIVETFHNWQSENYKELYSDVKGYCSSVITEKKYLTEEDIKNETKSIESMGFNLVPSKYIEFDKQINNIDYDSEMKRIQTELKLLLKQEQESKKDLLRVLEELGYGIKD